MPVSLERPVLARTVPDGTNIWRFLESLSPEAKEVLERLSKVEPDTDYFDQENGDGETEVPGLGLVEFGKEYRVSARAPYRGGWMTCFCVDSLRREDGEPLVIEHYPGRLKRINLYFAERQYIL
jgi:hypothetical protein